jgi:carboxyl-terminal processing protease
VRRAGAIACGGLALAGAFALGFWALDGDGAPVSAPTRPAPVFHHGPIYGYGPVATPAPPTKPPLALEQVRLALAQAYYRHVSPTWLAEPTIDAILARLDDPYTEYLSPAEYERIQQRLEQRYYGIGLTVDPRKAGLVVTGSLAGPAREAGIRPGDLIVTIDGQPASGLPFDRSVALIKGERGTVVRLGVRQPGRKQLVEVEVERGPVSVEPVRARMLERAGRRTGYVQLLGFSSDAAEQVGAATKRLAKRGAEAFVLDLRGDPGGYLAQAIRVASVFLDRGVVCATSGVNQEARVYTVSGAAIDTERPLAVLVDSTSASASEIVAGALRDNRRAVIVGTRTYGKATVQSLVALSNGGALKLTTATYQTPSGSSIGGRGIKPKIKVLDDPTTRRDEALIAAERVLLERLAAG